jgi:site-specific DNA recombinase
MNAAIYCRVSTDDQEKEGTSLQTQREACLSYCQQKGYEVTRQFAETFSGLTLDRPKLTELRNIIRANDVDIVVVYCLDRLSRNPNHGVILQEELEKHNVNLEAVTETVESTDLGKLISYIRGFASQLEAEKIRERTMRGKVARLKEGKLPHGTGIGIYGYDWNSDTGQRTINEPEAKVVQQIYAWVIQGFSFHRIAVRLNKDGIKSKSGLLFHPQNIRRIVTNEAYAGKTYSGKTKRVSKNKVIARPKEDWFLLPDVTPPIIDEQTFKQAQEARTQAKQSRPIKEKASYLLSGFMRCGKCGSSVSGTTLDGKYRYYKCQGSVATATRGKICDGKYIKADDLEMPIWNKFIEMLTSPITVLTLLTDIGSIERQKSKQSNTSQVLDKQIKNLRRKLKAYPAKEKTLYSLLTQESITKEYVLDEVNKLKKNLSKDQKELDSLLSNRKQSTNDDDISVKLSELSEAFRLNASEFNSDPLVGIQNKRAFMNTLGLKVIIDPVSGDYEFSFRLIGEIIKSSEAHVDQLFNKELQEFEKQHPEFNIEDLLDLNKQLPGDSVFASYANEVKQNLVTREQTSGCLSSYAYSWLIPFTFTG